MVTGYNGKILRVDLSNGNTSIDKPDPNFYRQYVGGRGFISYFLLKELEAGVDPLGPDNKLIFAGGPVTGVPIAGSARNSVGAKSPLTNGYGDAEVGGYWGAKLRRAGYDAVIIEGRSDKPVYISINNTEVEIRDAKHIWGKTTLECEKLIKEELGKGDVRIAQIGLAGENLVRYACVLNDLSHAAGRTGLGAVMGSKNLRAIAVRGQQKITFQDEKGIKLLARELHEFLKTDKKSAFLSKYGTQGTMLAKNQTGSLPTRNFQYGQFEGVENFDGDTINESILVKRGTCYACPIRCKPHVAVGPPYNVDPVYGGPEYETLASLGSNCGIDNLNAVAKGDELCSMYGLDTISTGVSIAFAMECFEQGILTQKDADGLDLKFGNADTMLKMIGMIARREGIGDLLAQGVARASREIGKGAQDLAMHVKGQELPLHEPRFKQGMGLGYALSPTGADHIHNMHDTNFTEVIPDKLKSFGILDPLPVNDLSAAKVRMLIYHSLWVHTLNSLGYCIFVKFPPEKMADLVKNITGWNSSVWELMKAGERSVTLSRLFNIREGITKADDSLPKRFFKPFASGPLEGVGVNEQEIQRARDTYYKMLGWDRDGVPSLPKLQELGIGWAAL